MAFCPNALFPWIKLLEINTCIISNMISFYNSYFMRVLWFQVSLSFHFLAFRNVKFAWQMATLVLAVTSNSAMGRYAERASIWGWLTIILYLAGYHLLDFSLYLWVETLNILFTLLLWPVNSKLWISIILLVKFMFMPPDIPFCYNNRTCHLWKT